MIKTILLLIGFATSSLSIAAPHKCEMNGKITFQDAPCAGDIEKNEKVHVRGNYRMRLESIRRAAEKAITDYDIEMGTVKPPRYGKGQR